MQEQQQHVPAQGIHCSHACKEQVHATVILYILMFCKMSDMYLQGRYVCT
jgi:hypothetical protein